MIVRWGIAALCLAAVVATSGCVSAPLYTSKTYDRFGNVSRVEPRPAQQAGQARTTGPVAASMVPVQESRFEDDPEPEVRVVSTFRGEASYYASDFHGKMTASGERFDMHDMTAAHRTLPFGTLVRVNNTDNGKSVTVRVNDRGPFKRRRVLDVSLEAAKQLGMIDPGTAQVRCEVLGAP